MNTKTATQNLDESSRPRRMLRAVRLHRAAAVVRRFATAPDLFAVLGVEVRRMPGFCCACLTVCLVCRQRRFDLDDAELHGSYKALMVRRALTTQFTRT